MQQHPENKEAQDRKSRRLKAILELRKLVIDGHSPGDIQEALGLSRRTYYRYLRTAFEPDRRALEAQNTNEIMRQVSVLLERNNMIFKILRGIAEDPKISGEDRIEACREMNLVTKGNLNIYKQTPGVPITFKKFIEGLKQPDNVLSSSSTPFRLPPAAIYYDPAAAEQYQRQLQEQQQEQEQASTAEVVRAGDDEETDPNSVYRQQESRDWWV